ncbi:MAG: hypothetical protein HY306_12525 [Nitrosomonadales bacterium]|nr:hypothetical protein [Nitrosomonadales bacterium]
MATKKSKEAKPPAITDKERTEHLSKMALLPSTNAAAVVQAFGKGTFGEPDFLVLVTELREQFTKVENGDLQYCESMLVGQAHALQSIFVSLARRAINQEYLTNYETFLRLALKAQNQSRMTLETLAAIKNPPVVFAKQANINHGNGNQQVNNGTPPAMPNIPHAPTHAEKNINQPNELLEVQHGSETLDAGTTGKAIRKNKAMAAVG